MTQHNATNVRSDGPLSAFTGQYKATKTLKFELKPIGNTMETVRRRFLSGDMNRAAAYPEVKELLDAEHKALLDRVFASGEDFGIDWSDLAKSTEDYRRGDKTKEAKSCLAAKQNAARKVIVARFRKDEGYKALTAPTPKEAIAAMSARIEAEGGDVPEALRTFAKFAGYFKGYQEARCNIYTDKEQSTAAAFRAVNVNFPKFMDDVGTFNYIAEKYPSIIADAEKELAPMLGDRTLASMFAVGAYGAFMSQSRIDFFNQVIGGFTTAEGAKVRGLNEFVNLYRQQNEDARADRGLVPLRPLFKQILSDRETISFVPQSFNCDGEVVEALCAAFQDTLSGKESGGGILGSMQAVLAKVQPSRGIWIDGSEIDEVSKNLLGSWNALGNLMRETAYSRFASETTEKKRTAAVDKWMNQSVFAMDDLTGMTRATAEGSEAVDVAGLWKGAVAAAKFGNARNAVSAALTRLSEFEKESTPLRERRGTVDAIKVALDAVMDILHFAKPLAVGGDLARDESFYCDFDPLYAALDGFVPLYNVVRNYMTKKPGQDNLIKMTFDNPSLASGWDQNKEKDSTSVIFLRDGNYYLGIMDPADKTDFAKLAGEATPGCYRKMVYKLLPGPNKMLPKVFFSEKGKATFCPPESLVRRYENGDYKKGENFDLAFCRRLIDFFKQGIAAHHDWRKFDFRFSPTESYNGIDEFYREVSEQGYKITFDNISSETIDRLVEEGKICLFQIWNKDFSPESSGRPNLETMYWNAVFAPENLRDVVVKLNGEAEVFYRPKTVEKPFVHRTGEKMVNRRARDGAPIPEPIHGELLRHFNGGECGLSKEAKWWLDSGRVVVKDVAHAITKDRRFAEDKFFFHVPVTINFKSPDKPIRLNEQVWDFIRANPGVNIIGIDRGERNLIYLTLIDPHGNILKQKSLNVVESVRHDGASVSTDYHAKLTQIEKDRADARLSWREIGAIKDFKAGYLAQVVHEIARMMVENNAIVVLEDLNFGFKQGRMRVEKSAYQQFESALIKKLNYLVFKERSASEPGGVLRGYQFTDKLDSFEKIGRQTGFLFYVPAGYTSKIDPTTGFTNIFNTKKCTNAVGIKEFFSQFDSIRWEAGRGAFAFGFNYSRVRTGQEGADREWTVYSAKRRLVYDKAAKSDRTVNPTGIILEALKSRGVEVADGFDLGEYLKSTEPSKANAAFFRSVFYAFDKTLQMRNSNATEDYIESPVLNARGEFFDSRRADDSLPKDADANGAYHIALKGLMLVRRIREAGDGRVDLKIANADWFGFAQEMSAGKVR